MVGTCVRAQPPQEAAKRKTELPPVFNQTDNENAHRSPMVKTYLTPTRIVWQSDNSGEFIQHPELLLKKSNGQVAVNDPKLLRLISTEAHKPGILGEDIGTVGGDVAFARGVRNADPTVLVETVHEPNHPTKSCALPSVFIWRDGNFWQTQRFFNNKQALLNI